MTDTKDLKPAEVTPTRSGEISALASASAPVILFDSAPFYHVYDGIGSITLALTRHVNAIGLEVVSDRMLVTHLKGGLAAFKALEQDVQEVIKGLEAERRHHAAGARALEAFYGALPGDQPLKN